MSFDQAPAHWLPGMTCDGEKITIPLAALPGLTAAQADPAQGDVRKLLMTLTESVWNHWNQLPPADRSTKMQLNKGANVNVQGGTMTATYSLTFIAPVTVQDLAPEA